MLTEEKFIETSADQLSWFAMSATFGRELKAKTYLEERNIRCFVPMKYEMVNDPKQGKIRKLIPALRNLIFVHTTKEQIQTEKSCLGYLHYLTKPEGGSNVPIIVPEYQMQQFITVCDTYDDHLVYLSPNEIKLEKGTPVKIIGSAFDGVEGTFVKVDGVRQKKVVVLVQGITAVMVAKFTNGYLQVLDKS